jgi:hypothetical protein
MAYLIDNLCELLTILDIVLIDLSNVSIFYTFFRNRIKYHLFTGSTSMTIEGDFESTQTSILLFVFDTTCDWILAAFSIPYNSSVLSVVDEEDGVVVNNMQY